MIVDNMEAKNFDVKDSEVGEPVMQVLGDMVAITPKESRKVLWKLDLCLLPLLAFCYMLQFLDKSSLNYSALLGLRKDTNLQGAEYSWTAAIFYFGYIAWSYPTAYLVVRFPIGKYLSFTVLAWAIVLMCHAACENFAGLMVARFFLGVTEAAVAPGFSLMTGMFYTRLEQPFRHGVWFLGNSLASIVGGVIAYGIGNTHTSLAPWRVLFLIFGAITAFWSVVMFVLLPDSPDSARYMTEKEKMIAVARVSENKTGSVKSGAFRKHQMLEALKDPQAWLLALYVFCVNLPNGGLTAFGSLVIAGFGFKGLEALLLQMPTGAAQFIFVLIGCLICTKVKSARLITMIILTLISLVGMVMMSALDHTHRNAKLGRFCLALAFAANTPLGLSLVSSNVTGFTKKGTVNAMVFIGYCAGNIVGPQFYLASEEPNYPTGIKASLAGFCLGAFFIVCLGIYYLWENRRRDRAHRTSASNTEERVKEIGGELTDWQIKSFRYLL